MKAPGIFIGNAIGKSRSSYWTQAKINDSCLFYASHPTGLLSKVVATQLPNQVTGSSDYLTVTGTGLNARYRTPNTAAYKTADSDYVFWKSDASESICDGNRLVGYDFPRILVKYLNASPYTILAIAILKPGVTVTNGMRDAFDLSVWWDNTLSDHGSLKENRIVGQSAWTAEVVKATYVSDTFTGADDTVLNSHNPEVFPSTSWTGAYFKILNNKAACSGAGGAVYHEVIDCGHADVDMSVDYTMPAELNYAMGITLRGYDDLVGWNIYVIRTAGGTPALKLMEAATERGSVNLTHTDNGTFVLQVTAIGNDIKVYWGGVLKISYTSASWNTETRMGLYAYRDATYKSAILDNFFIKEP